MRYGTATGLRLFRRCAVGLGAWLLLSASPLDAQLVFEENFSAGLGQMTDSVPCGDETAAFWAFSSMCDANEPSQRAATARFGEVPGCTSYGDGAVFAVLETPELSLAGCRQLTLSYFYYLDFQESAGTDKVRVLVRTNDGTRHQLANNGGFIGQASSCSGFFSAPPSVTLQSDASWHEVRHDLLELPEEAFTTGPVTIRFEADITNGTSNSGEGFLIDRVRVACSRQGDQFQVNSYTTSYQWYSSVASDAAGNFIVAWRNGYYGPAQVVARTFSADGLPNGDDFLVFTTGLASTSISTAGSDDEFVVVWRNVGVGATDLIGRRISTTGTAIGAFLLVNAYTSGDQLAADVSAAPDGRFVVAWVGDGSSGNDTADRSIQARRFNSDGSANGSDFQVNTTTEDDQSQPSVAMRSDGGFLVAWTNPDIPFGGADEDDDGNSIRAQLYLSNGALAGPQILVNSYTSGDQDDPQVAALPDGSFVVVWESSGSPENDDSGSSIQARFVDAGGATDGAQFQVNEYTPFSQYYPAVAAQSDGTFLVVWNVLRARLFSAEGEPIGTDQEVLQPGSHWFDHDVASGLSGGFVVSWHGYPPHSDSSARGIMGRVFEPVIFADGFESGDTSAWSLTTP